MISFQSEMFQTEIVEKKHTFYVQYFFSSENRAVYDIMWKNMVESDRSQITLYYSAEKIRLACRIPKARIQTHTLPHPPLWRCGPTRAMASSFTRFLDHTQRRITVGRTPLDE